jgi:hypothetical protein
MKPRHAAALALVGWYLMPGGHGKNSAKKGAQWETHQAPLEN